MRVKAIIAEDMRPKTDSMSWVNCREFMPFNARPYTCGLLIGLVFNVCFRDYPGYSYWTLHCVMSKLSTRNPTHFVAGPSVPGYCTVNYTKLPFMSSIGIRSALQVVSHWYSLMQEWYYVAHRRSVVQNFTC